MSEFVEITKNTEINTNCKVRRHGDGSYIEFYVVGWREDENRYELKEVLPHYERQNINFLTSPDDLIKNFQIEISSD